MTAAKTSKLRKRMQLLGASRPPNLLLAEAFWLGVVASFAPRRTQDAEDPSFFSSFSASNPFLDKWTAFGRHSHEASQLVEDLLVGLPTASHKLAFSTGVLLSNESLSVHSLLKGFHYTNLALSQTPSFAEGIGYSNFESNSRDTSDDLGAELLQEMAISLESARVIEETSSTSTSSVIEASPISLDVVDELLRSEVSGSYTTAALPGASAESIKSEETTSTLDPSRSDLTELEEDLDLQADLGFIVAENSPDTYIASIDPSSIGLEGLLPVAGAGGGGGGGGGSSEDGGVSDHAISETSSSNSASAPVLVAPSPGTAGSGSSGSSVGGSGSGSGSGGGGGTSTQPVSFLGTVIDGYVAGATVFIDTNSNLALDWTDSDNDGVWDLGEGEIWTLTDRLGGFSFSTTQASLLQGNVVSQGGVDTGSGAAIGLLVAESGQGVVTPISSVMALAGNSDIANAFLDRLLGIHANTNLTDAQRQASRDEALALDPVAGLNGESAQAQLAQTLFATGASLLTVTSNAAALASELDGSGDSVAAGANAFRAISNLAVGNADGIGALLSGNSEQAALVLRNVFEDTLSQAGLTGDEIAGYAAILESTVGATSQISAALASLSTGNFDLDDIYSLASEGQAGLLQEVKKIGAAARNGEDVNGLLASLSSDYIDASIEDIKTRSLLKIKLSNSGSSDIRTTPDVVPVDAPAFGNQQGESSAFNLLKNDQLVSGQGELKLMAVSLLQPADASVGSKTVDFGLGVLTASSIPNTLNTLTLILREDLAIDSDKLIGQTVTVFDGQFTLSSIVTGVDASSRSVTLETPLEGTASLVESPVAVHYLLGYTPPENLTLEVDQDTGLLVINNRYLDGDEAFGKLSLLYVAGVQGKSDVFTSGIATVNVSPPRPSLEVNDANQGVYAFEMQESVDAGLVRGGESYSAGRLGFLAEGFGFNGDLRITGLPEGSLIALGNVDRPPPLSDDLDSLYEDESLFASSDVRGIDTWIIPTAISKDLSALDLFIPSDVAGPYTLKVVATAGYAGLYSSTEKDFSLLVNPQADGIDTDALDDLRSNFHSSTIFQLQEDLQISLQDPLNIHGDSSHPFGALLKESYERLSSLLKDTDGSEVIGFRLADNGLSNLTLTNNISGASNEPLFFYSLLRQGNSEPPDDYVTRVLDDLQGQLASWYLTPNSNFSNQGVDSNDSRAFLTLEIGSAERQGASGEESVLSESDFAWSGELILDATVSPLADVPSIQVLGVTDPVVQKDGRYLFSFDLSGALVDRDGSERLYLQIDNDAIQEAGLQWFDDSGWNELGDWWQWDSGGKLDDQVLVQFYAPSTISRPIHLEVRAAAKEAVDSTDPAYSAVVQATIPFVDKPALPQLALRGTYTTSEDKLGPFQENSNLELADLIIITPAAGRTLESAGFFVQTNRVEADFGLYNTLTGSAFEDRWQITRSNNGEITANIYDGSGLTEDLWFRVKATDLENVSLTTRAFFKTGSGDPLSLKFLAFDTSTSEGVKTKYAASEREIMLSVSPVADGLDGSSTTGFSNVAGLNAVALTPGVALDLIHDSDLFAGLSETLSEERTWLVDRDESLALVRLVLPNSSGAAVNLRFNDQIIAPSERQNDLGTKDLVWTLPRSELEDLYKDKSDASTPTLKLTLVPGKTGFAAEEIRLEAVSQDGASYSPATIRALDLVVDTRPQAPQASFSGSTGLEDEPTMLNVFLDADPSRSVFERLGLEVTLKEGSPAELKDSVFQWGVDGGAGEVAFNPNLNNGKGGWEIFSANAPIDFSTLQLKTPENYSGSFTLELRAFAQALASGNRDYEETSQETNVLIKPVAEQVEDTNLQLEMVGAEDSGVGIPLPLRDMFDWSQMTDPDEVLSISIKVAEALKLWQGETELAPVSVLRGEATFNVSLLADALSQGQGSNGADPLNAFYLTSPLNFSSQPLGGTYSTIANGEEIEVSVTSFETDGSASPSVSQVIALDITPVPDSPPPLIQVVTQRSISESQASENGAVWMKATELIRLSSRTSSDPSETLHVDLSGSSENLEFAVLMDGSYNANIDWSDLTPLQYSSLYVRGVTYHSSASGSDGEEFKVAIYTKEGGTDLESERATQSAHIFINPVASGIDSTKPFELDGSQSIQEDASLRLKLDDLFFEIEGSKKHQVILDASETLIYRFEIPGLNAEGVTVARINPLNQAPSLVPVSTRIDEAGNRFRTFEVKKEDLDQYELQTGLHYSGDFDIFVQALAKEGGQSSALSDPKTISVQVEAVADQPIVSATPEAFGLVRGNVDNQFEDEFGQTTSIPIRVFAKAEDPSEKLSATVWLKAPDSEVNKFGEEIFIAQRSYKDSSVGLLSRFESGVSGTFDFDRDGNLESALKFELGNVDSGKAFWFDVASTSDFRANEALEFRVELTSTEPLGLDAVKTASAVSSPIRVSAYRDISEFVTAAVDISGVMTGNIDSQIFALSANLDLGIENPSEWINQIGLVVSDVPIGAYFLKGNENAFVGSYLSQGNLWYFRGADLFNDPNDTDSSTLTTNLRLVDFSQGGNVDINFEFTVTDAQGGTSVSGESTKRLIDKGSGAYEDPLVWAFNTTSFSSVDYNGSDHLTLPSSERVSPKAWLIGNADTLEGYAFLLRPEQSSTNSEGLDPDTQSPLLSVSDVYVDFPDLIASLGLESVARIGSDSLLSHRLWFDLNADLRVSLSEVVEVSEVQDRFGKFYFELPETAIDWDVSQGGVIPLFQSGLVWEDSSGNKPDIHMLAVGLPVERQVSQDHVVNLDSSLNVSFAITESSLTEGVVSLPAFDIEFRELSLDEGDEATYLFVIELSSTKDPRSSYNWTLSAGTQLDRSYNDILMWDNRWLLTAQELSDLEIYGIDPEFAGDITLRTTTFATIFTNGNVVSRSSEKKEFQFEVQAVTDPVNLSVSATSVSVSEGEPFDLKGLGLLIASESRELASAELLISAETQQLLPISRPIYLRVSDVSQNIHLHQMNGQDPIVLSGEAIRALQDGDLSFQVGTLSSQGNFEEDQFFNADLRLSIEARVQDGLALPVSETQWVDIDFIPVVGNLEGPGNLESPVSFDEPFEEGANLAFSVDAHTKDPSETAQLYFALSANSDVGGLTRSAVLNVQDATPLNAAPEEWIWEGPEKQADYLFFQWGPSDSSGGTLNSIQRDFSIAMQPYFNGRVDYVIGGQAFDQDNGIAGKVSTLASGTWIVQAKINGDTDDIRLEDALGSSIDQVDVDRSGKFKQVAINFASPDADERLFPDLTLRLGNSDFDVDLGESGNLEFSDEEGDSNFEVFLGTGLVSGTLSGTILEGDATQAFSKSLDFYFEPFPEVPTLATQDPLRFDVSDGGEVNLNLPLGNLEQASGNLRYWLTDIPQGFDLALAAANEVSHKDFFEITRFSRNNGQKTVSDFMIRVTDTDELLESLNTNDPAYIAFTLTAPRLFSLETISLVELTGLPIEWYVEAVEPISREVDKSDPLTVSINLEPFVSDSQADAPVIKSTSFFSIKEGAFFQLPDAFDVVIPGFSNALEGSVNLDDYLQFKVRVPTEGQAFEILVNESKTYQVRPDGNTDNDSGIQDAYFSLQEIKNAELRLLDESAVGSFAFEIQAQFGNFDADQEGALGRSAWSLPKLFQVSVEPVPVPVELSIVDGTDGDSNDEMPTFGGNEGEPVAFPSFSLNNVGALGESDLLFLRIEMPADFALRRGDDDALPPITPLSVSNDANGVALALYEVQRADLETPSLLSVMAPRGYSGPSTIRVTAQTAVEDTSTGALIFGNLDSESLVFKITPSPTSPALELPETYIIAEDQVGSVTFPFFAYTEDDRDDIDVAFSLQFISDGISTNSTINTLLSDFTIEVKGVDAEGRTQTYFGNGDEALSFQFPESTPYSVRVIAPKDFYNVSANSEESLPLFGNDSLALRLNVVSYASIAGGARAYGNADIDLEVIGVNDRPSISLVTVGNVDRDENVSSEPTSIRLLDPDFSDALELSLKSVAISNLTDLNGELFTTDFLRESLKLYRDESTQEVLVSHGRAELLKTELWSVQLEGNFDALAEGETLKLAYQLEVDDQQGQGINSKDDLLIKYEVVGNNDNPSIKASDAEAEVIDLGRDWNAQGTISIQDPDRSDRLLLRVQAIEVSSGERLDPVHEDFAFFMQRLVFSGERLQVLSDSNWNYLFDDGESLGWSLNLDLQSLTPEEHQVYDRYFTAEADSQLRFQLEFADIQAVDNPSLAGEDAVLSQDIIVSVARPDFHIAPVSADHLLFYRPEGIQEIPASPLSSLHGSSSSPQFVILSSGDFEADLAQFELKVSNFFAQRLYSTVERVELQVFQGGNQILSQQGNLDDLSDGSMTFAIDVETIVSDVFVPGMPVTLQVRLDVKDPESNPLNNLKDVLVDSQAIWVLPSVERWFDQASGPDREEFFGAPTLPKGEGQPSNAIHWDGALEASSDTGFIFVDPEFGQTVSNVSLLDGLEINMDAVLERGFRYWGSELDETIVSMGGNGFGSTVVTNGGRDIVQTGEFSDLIVSSGSGTDLIAGGRGTDIFVIRPGEYETFSDIVTEFSSVTSLSPLLTSLVSQAEGSITFDGVDGSLGFVLDQDSLGTVKIAAVIEDFEASQSGYDHLLFSGFEGGTVAVSADLGGARMAIHRGEDATYTAAILLPGFESFDFNDMEFMNASVQKI